MSRCIVPKWNARQHNQERGGERKRSPHVHSDQNLCYAVPMCNNEVTELAWENGQLSLHGLGGKAGDTLESIVHHATSFNNGFSTSSAANWEQDRSMQDEQNDDVGGKLLGEMRGTSDEWERKNKNLVEGSAIAADTMTMTWPSLESPASFKTARTDDDDYSLYHDCSGNQDGQGTTKGESYKSQSSARRSRAAATHNLSERRRRDRINQKMKTLQKLVPNASKSDKASMLDEVIQYLKQLQAQVRMMSNARSMPQMVMPLGMQQQLQMSLPSRMGMGMLDVNDLARNVPHLFPPLINGAAPLGGVAVPSFVPPLYTMPPVVPPPMPLKPNVDANAISSTSAPNFNDAYNTFLAQQTMNMDLLNKMSALYRQQSSQQPSKKPVGSSPSSCGQGE